MVLMVFNLIIHEKAQSFQLMYQNTNNLWLDYFNNVRQQNCWFEGDR